MHGHYLVGWLWRAVWLVAAAFGVVSASAQVNVQPVPELTGRVIDTTATLSAAQQVAISQKLAAFEVAKGTQLVVLVVSTTAPEDIASFANRVGNTWKIGRKDIGDGVLLIVAKDDRKLRIEVAKTLEGAVPDLSAKRVIDQAIAPRFKQGDFAGGIDAGVDQLIALIQKEGLPDPSAASKAAETWSDVAGEVAVVDFVVMGLLLKVAGPAGAVAAIYCSIVGAVFGAIAWLIFSNGSIAFWSAMAGGVFGFLGLLKMSSSTGTSSKSRASRSSGYVSSSSNSDSGSSDGGFFSSGGGGDFGGGGASGDW
jgi:uncharacterized protein